MGVTLSTASKGHRRDLWRRIRPIGKFGTKTKHLLDIWKLYGECLRDEQFRLHKRRFKHVWGWGEEAAAWGLANNNGTVPLASR